MKSAVIGAILLTMFLIVAPAAAQSTRVYAGLGGMLTTTQPPEQCVEPSCPKAPLLGTAFGLSGEVGAALTPRFSLSFELGFPERFETVHETSSKTRRRDEHRFRDVMYSGLLHFHFQERDRYQWAVLAGGTFVRQDDVSRTANAVAEFSDVFRLYGDALRQTNWTVAFTSGADVAVRLSRRVDMVPQMRVHIVHRGRPFESRDGLVSLRLSDVVLRPAVDLRLTF